LFGIHPNYETGHYLPLDQMTKEQIRELKEAIQQGATLFHFAKRLIEKGDSFGWE
jgi:CBS domain-containing protein